MKKINIEKFDFRFNKLESELYKYLFIERIKIEDYDCNCLFRYKR